MPGIDPFIRIDDADLGSEVEAVDGDSIVFARLAAVPCRSLEPDRVIPDLVGVAFSPVPPGNSSLLVGDGLGLAVPSLALVTLPFARPYELLCFFSAVVSVSPAASERAFARLEAVGFMGVPVDWGLSGVSCVVLGVRRGGPVRAGVRCLEDAEVGSLGLERKAVAGLDELVRLRVEVVEVVGLFFVCMEVVGEVAFGFLVGAERGTAECEGVTILLPLGPDGRRRRGDRDIDGGVATDDCKAVAGTVAARVLLVVVGEVDGLAVLTAVEEVLAPPAGRGEVAGEVDTGWMREERRGSLLALDFAAAFPVVPVVLLPSAVLLGLLVLVVVELLVVVAVVGLMSSLAAGSPLVTIDGSTTASLEAESFRPSSVAGTVKPDVSTGRSTTPFLGFLSAVIFRSPPSRGTCSSSPCAAISSFEAFAPAPPLTTSSFTPSTTPITPFACSSGCG